MHLTYAKSVAALSLSVVTFLSSMLPLFLIRRFRAGNDDLRNLRTISFLSCFGGGVFMATCLLHLFPDVRDLLLSIFKKLNVSPHYPVAEFLLAFGFLAVLIVEQMVLSCQENPAFHVPALSHQHSHSDAIPRQIHTNYGTISDVSQHSIPDDNPTGLVHCESSNSEYHSHEVSFHQDLSSHSVLRSLLLVFALSLHSIFEGLAIGLQSSVQRVIRILLAVLIHKSIIAFTLGLNLTHSQLKQSNIIKGNVFFSLTSPIGIVIGLIVVDFVSGLPMLITSSILQGLAAGTFLYVTFFEVLPHELNSSDNRMLKMLFLVFGFSAVSILLLIFPDQS